MRHLEDKVKHILANYPATRNSDVELTVKIVEQYYPQCIHTAPDGRRWVHESILFEIKTDNVSRCRRKLNEKGLFLATDPVVAARRQREVDMKNWALNT